MLTRTRTKEYHDDSETKYGYRAVSTLNASAAHQLHPSMPAVEATWKVSVPNIVPKVVPETAVRSFALFCLGTAVTFTFGYETPSITPGWNTHFTCGNPPRESHVGRRSVVSTKDVDLATLNIPRSYP